MLNHHVHQHDLREATMSTEGILQHISAGSRKGMSRIEVALTMRLGRKKMHFLVNRSDTQEHSGGSLNLQCFCVAILWRMQHMLSSCFSVAFGKPVLEYSIGELLHR